MSEFRKEWAEKLLQTMEGLYGAEFGRRWGGYSPDEVCALWAREMALAGIGEHGLRAGLQALRQEARPPSIPRFIQMCRENARPAVEAKMVEYDGYTRKEDAKAKIANLLALVGNGPAARDAMYWAKHPKSVKAVELLFAGAEHDERLRSIIRSHIETQGEKCRSDDAVLALAARLESPPSWLSLQTGEAA